MLLQHMLSNLRILTSKPAGEAVVFQLWGDVFYFIFKNMMEAVTTLWRGVGREMYLHKILLANSDHLQNLELEFKDIFLFR